MFIPRHISHMAMKMLRLLKNRMGSTMGEGLMAFGSRDMNVYVVRKIQRAMALPTLRMVKVIVLCCIVCYVCWEGL